MNWDKLTRTILAPFCLVGGWKKDVRNAKGQFLKYLAFNWSASEFRTSTAERRGSCCAVNAEPCLQQSQSQGSPTGKMMLAADVTVSMANEKQSYQPHFDKEDRI